MADLRLCEDSYANPALAAAAQQSLNLYRETYDGFGAGTGKSSKILTGTPGWKLLVDTNSLHIRGFWSGGGRCFVVSGSNILEIDKAGVIISSYNLVLDDGHPVEIFGNGNQLGLVYRTIVGGGFFLINNGAGWAPALFQQAGVVNVTGTTVTWVSGQQFNGNFAGLSFYINNQPVTVTGPPSPTSLSITVAIAGGSGTGYLLFNGTFNSVLQDISPSFVGLPITIGGTVYTVASVGPLDPITGLTSWLNVSNPNGDVLTPSGLVAWTVTQTNMPYTAAAGDAVTAITGAYLDGSFYVQRPAGGSPDLGRQVNFSGLNPGGVGDGTIWNGLDFFTKEGAPDYIQAIFADREQLYVFGTETSEVWQVSTTTGRPVRLDGAVFKEGLAATYSVVTMSEHLYYLGGSPIGTTVAFRLDGFTPTRVSTHAVEEAWRISGAQVKNSVAWEYLENGHFFWVICFDIGSTWVYDATERSWHERAGWDGTKFIPYAPFFHTFIPEWGDNGQHIIGDHKSGKVWIMSSDTFSEDGKDVKRVRVMPYIFAGGNKRVYCDRVDLTMATGLASSSSAPLVELAWSEDDGQTFSADQPAGYGAAGQTETRVYWVAQGSAETAMMPRISVTGQNEIVMIAADGEIAAGST